MESVWYYVVNGNQVGPVSLDELKAVAAARKLAPTDLVWQEGTPDWVPASTVAGLFGAAPPRPTSAPPQAGYALSPPPPPPPAAPSALDPDPLALEGDLGPPRTRSRSRRDDGGAPAPAPEWLNLIQVFLRRVAVPDPAQVKPEPAEDAALTRSGVMDATSRKFAVWRRAVLFVAAVPCAFAALFGLIDVIAMEKKQKEFFSAFGLLLFYVRAFAVFALPVAAVFAALAYDRLAVSARWVLVGGLVAFAVPLAVAFVPGEMLVEREMGRLGGAQIGPVFFLLLVPVVCSVLPALSRACVRMKLLLPESLVPGWCLVTAAPLCAVLALVSFVMLYHFVGNVVMLLGLFLCIGAPLLYLLRVGLLTRPVTEPADREGLSKLSPVVLGTMAAGVLLLFIYMFTAKFGGVTILGFDEDKSAIRPWSIELHRTWLEYLGRSLFLTVLFADLLLKVALSVWKEERAFAGSAQSPAFDRTLSGLDSAVLPRGKAPQSVE